MNRFADWGLLLLRIVVGIIFIMHGQMKWGIWSAPAGMMSTTMLTIFKVLSVVEPLLGICIILGVITEWSSLILAIDMIGAMLFKISGGTAFIGHQTTGWEFDLTVFAANIILLMHGSGWIALDRLWKKSGSGTITTVKA